MRKGSLHAAAVVFREPGGRNMSMWTRLFLIATAAVFCLIALAQGDVRAQWQPVIHTTACPFAYQPVCARKKGVLVTYSNACVARANQGRIVSDGVCPEDCPAIYKPVCARDANGTRRTYANTCIAKKQNAQIIRNTRCLFPRS